MTAGFTTVRFTMDGFTAVPFTTAGFTAVRFTTDGFTAVRFTTAGFTAVRFTTDGFTAVRFTTAGFTAVLRWLALRRLVLRLTHFYDLCRAGPRTSDFWCITVATQASFPYSVRF
jgi:hypothetical protein